ncbi:NAD-dependent succinate-semialdehyde dehydrogenase [Blastococcus atacamensis]|uniref:NAD-dependent succinate-semialdehyde dehydrogenase n=1 Tax=Blastococcus atacamensis TaxID=2070508 RepID=UPI000CEC74E8|nr:NAD-dependent succinate-semialdehyde dehydrogenase [Blastococcus atacamensis]
MTALDDRPWMSTIPTDLYIGGNWRQAGRPDPIPVLDPATEQVLVTVADASPEDGIAAVDAAAAALPGWAAASPRHRSDVLMRAFALMTERREQLAELIVLENGKALADARGEVAYAAEFFRWYAEEAVRAAGTVQTAPAGTNNILVLRQPIGVAVLVTPWNFPAAMATRKIGPALAAGCTVVLKPATETPLTAFAIVALLEEAGVPPGVVNCVTTRSAGSVVKAMVDDPRVRKLSFTGSTEVGRRLLATAAETVVSCSMELGGNAPFLVLADADLDTAVAGAMLAKMRNGGSACTAANRFYVHASIEREFASRLSVAMSRLRVGNGLDAGVDVGPLVNAPTRDKVAELVTGALDGGAAVLSGGSAPDRPGFFYTPTVLGEVPADASILREEIFGPVAPVVPFDTVDEAIALANDTEYGLVSYVYTGDLAQGLAVSERLDSGMVGLNRGVVSDPAAPFGGTKQSGVGREGGHEGMLEYLESKYIAVGW